MIFMFYVKILIRYHDDSSVRENLDRYGGAVFNLDILDFEVMGGIVGIHF